MLQENFKITCSDGNEMVEKRLSVDGAVKITLQGGCRAYTNHHILEGRLEFSLENSTYQLNPINTTQLLSTPYFTITADTWNTWSKIHDKIGSPEGLLFKDIGPLYWKYEQHKWWNIGISSIVGIVAPIFVIFLMYYFRKRIFAFCMSKAPAGRRVDFSLLSQGGNTRPIYNPPTASPTPRMSPPRTPLSSSTEMVTTGINTPRTARKILNSMNWSEEDKTKFKSNAELISLAEEGKLSEATGTDSDSVKCKSCNQFTRRCRCMKK